MAYNSVYYNFISSVSVVGQLARKQVEYCQSGSVRPPAVTRVPTISINDRSVQSYSVRPVLLKSSTN